jgi:MFS family permease
VEKNEKYSPKIFFGLSSFQMLAMFRRGLFYSYLSIYLRFLGLSVTETTLFATLPMILNVGFQTFVWGILSDKYQRRRFFIILGEILAGFGTLIVFLAHRMVDLNVIAGWIIIIGLSLIEIFWSMSNIGWSALLSDLYPLKTRNTVLGQLSSVGGLGRIIGVWIGGLLYDGLKLYYPGWGFFEGSLFYVAAIAMFISTIPLFFIPEGGVRSGPQKQGKYMQSFIESSNLNSNSSSPLKVYIVFLIAITLINFGRNSIAVIFSQYLTLPTPGFGISSELLSYVINAQSIAIILVGLFIGKIGLRIGNGNTVLLGAILSVFVLLLVAFSMDLNHIFIASFLRGAAQVIIMASSYAFASGLINPQSRGKLFGLYNATFFLSWGMAGTIIAGPIIDYLMMIGTSEVLAYRMAFLAGSLITLFGGVLLGILLVWIRFHPILDYDKQKQFSES